MSTVPRDPAAVAMVYPVIADQFSYLAGKVLTIIDASYTDPVQRKAVKDLVRDKFQLQVAHLERLCKSAMEEGVRQGWEHIVRAGCDVSTNSPKETK